LLESISDVPGSNYKKVKNNIINLQSKLNTVEQKIKASNQLSEQANKDLEAAQRLAMEASIIVQNPPHPLEIWQQAQAKWQESIKLLEAIPENLPAYVQAQEKLVTYQTNYAALTKRIEIEQKASDTINTIEDLAKQSVELVKNTPYTIEVLKKAQENLK
jgi:CII-binding regulator of phage lambda lysogenization HflD